MTEYTEFEGDLFTSDAPAQMQGVNVDGVMGSGIAPVFKRLYPAMFDEYRDLCLAGKLLPGGVHAWHGPDKTIYNVASQQRPGADARIDWLESSIAMALDDAAATGIPRIAMPLIGCGIGGLNWTDVRPVVMHLAASGTVDIDVWIKKAVR